MKGLALIAASLLLMGSTGCDVRNIESDQPSGDSATLTPAEAIDLALPSILEAFPDATSDPDFYKSRYEGCVWEVYPKLGDETLGGGPSAELDDATRTVTRTYFGE